MTRLFVTDIDGCLADPYTPFNLEHLSLLAERTARAGRPGDDPVLPAISICSGRSYPYVEAMCQLLGCRVPVLFESGAGMFDCGKATCTWHPKATSAVRRQVDQVRAYMEGVVAGTGMSIDYAKVLQAALVGTDPGELAEAATRIASWVRENAPDFETFTTHVSIDVVPRWLTKREGLMWLSDTTGVPLDEMAYMGDTNGDIGALEVVGASFAPANARPEVKQVVDTVTPSPYARGVIDAFVFLVASNEDRLHALNGSK
ncbi:MAG: haloacid dehalogenase [Bacteroidetes bacterium CG12_big_fil_rev_8_21_14_0_65_60_17]|nr:MAG: haloacid dehalogenase [Bacteroidetes bacterium CG12_big_fil_rev_8_21_14_0_65_60_17]